MKIQVIFHSLYGHVWKLAEAVAEGARSIKDMQVELFQVPETLPNEVLEKMGALQTRQQFAHIPVASPEILKDADGIILGTPTRFGNMTAQMRAFLDHTGSLWAKSSLVGKVGSVFTSSSTQHGGHETTIISTWLTLIHHGMIIVGVPYTEKRLSTMEEITGGGPYGAGCVSGHGIPNRPSENELAIARFQGRHVAEITRALVLGRQAG